jgi:chemotaxis protein MotA
MHTGLGSDMLVIIGYLIVLGSVFGGFVMAGGHLGALFQPLELLMIGGAAIGAFVVGNSSKVVKATLKALPGVLKGPRYAKIMYSDLLGLLYTLLTKIRQNGPLSIEADIEDPHSSALFNNFPRILHNHHVMEFITDYLRMIITANMSPFQLEALMDNEIETLHHEELIPVHAISKLADGMPAFGIVAAVMGVVHTMESISLPPSELGILIAHALVGTFLGILLGYGFIGPLAPVMEQRANEEQLMLQCIKVILLASLHNHPPKIAIEFGRKVLFATERPSSSELETLVKDLKSAA